MAFREDSAAEAFESLKVRRIVHFVGQKVKPRPLLLIGGAVNSINFENFILLHDLPAFVGA